MKKLFSLIIFFFSLAATHAQGIVTEGELTEKQNDYYLQPTLRNGVGVKRSIPVSTLKNYLSLNPYFYSKLFISNNENISNYTRLGFSFANTSISASDAYFDYSYKGAFGSIQTRRLFTLKLGSVTMPSDTIRINNLLVLNDITDVRSAINSKLEFQIASTFQEIGNSIKKRLIFVETDESNAGLPSFYFHNGTKKQWIPLIEVE